MPRATDGEFQAVNFDDDFLTLKTHDLSLLGKIRCTVACVVWVTAQYNNLNSEQHNVHCRTPTERPFTKNDIGQARITQPWNPSLLPEIKCNILHVPRGVVCQ